MKGRELVFLTRSSRNVEEEGKGISLAGWQHRKDSGVPFFFFLLPQPAAFPIFFPGYPGGCERSPQNRPGPLVTESLLAPGLDRTGWRMVIQSTDSLVFIIH